MSRALSLDKTEVVAVKRLLFLQSLLFLTPGIIQLFMGERVDSSLALGDEYFSTLPFSEEPSVLDLDQVGEYDTTSRAWTTRGARFGLFNYTHTLLVLRQGRSVGKVHSRNL